MKTLEELKAEFELIKSYEEPTRTNHLTRLMNEIEKRYNIPLLRKHITQEILEGEHFKLYLEVSEARQL